MSDVEWRAFPLDERYMVGSDGTVLGLKGHPLSPGVAKHRKYPQTNLRLGGKGGRQLSVHRIVALTFLGPPPEGYEIDHIDNDPLNNNIGNLQYVTHAENMRLMSERQTHCRAEGHSLVDAYIYNGYRKCKPCHLARVNARMRQLRADAAAYRLALAA